MTELVLEYGPDLAAVHWALRKELGPLCPLPDDLWMVIKSL